MEDSHSLVLDEIRRLREKLASKEALPALAKPDVERVNAFHLKVVSTALPLLPCSSVESVVTLNTVLHDRAIAVSLVSLYIPHLLWYSHWYLYIYVLIISSHPDQSTGHRVFRKLQKA